MRYKGAMQNPDVETVALERIRTVQLSGRTVAIMCGVCVAYSTCGRICTNSPRVSGIPEWTCARAKADTQLCKIM